ncbi:Tripeptidyl-peptidase II [Bertholletia excelsa]
MLGIQPADVERSTFIVHMDKSLMPKVFVSHHHWYASAVNSSARLVYAYDKILHGFAAILSDEELEAIQNSPGFVSAYPDREVKHRTTHTPEFLSLNPSTGLWPSADYGRDAIIGIEFNSSMCNKKLIGARYFNRGLIANQPGINISMNSARDTLGHGTHTSSTAAGNYVHGASFFRYTRGTTRGVAHGQGSQYQKTNTMYKVFWNEGFYTSDVLAGIDAAVADGVAVLSLSIGFDSDIPLYQNPIAISSFGAVENGVFVSHTGGNTGPRFGTLYDSIPWSLTVAAGSIDRTYAGKLTLGNGVIITGWTLFPADTIVENLPLLYNKTISLCNSALLLFQFRSNIIICEDTGTPKSQLLLAATSNVPASVIISDNPYLFEFATFQWPVVIISQNEGKAVIEYAKTSDKPKASISFKQTILGLKPAPTISPYSSRGLSRVSPEILKPDLTAPGTLVLAAWVPSVPATMIALSINLSSNYALLSGTSMACPHAASVAALLKAVQPKWSPAAVKSAMMITANPLDNTGNPIGDPALDPGLVYDITPQDYMNFLCKTSYTANQILTITRSRHYNCSKRMVKEQNGTRTHTKYMAKVVAPKGAKVTVDPKTLVFGKKYEKRSYTMTIVYNSYKKGRVRYRSLVWVEDGGKHKVRSPIVISPPLGI